jgi:hypothetical protein
MDSLFEMLPVDVTTTPGSRRTLVVELLGNRCAMSPEAWIAARKDDTELSIWFMS